MPVVPDGIVSSTFPRVTVFTAQSKRHYYCRDAICEFVFLRGAVPLNPFRAFGYFLGDRVDRQLIREANNNLIRLADELWVFGTTVANGVLFETAIAHELGKPVHFFTVSAVAGEIRGAPVEALRFESELYTKGYSREDLRAIALGVGRFEPPPLRLFDFDDLDALQHDPIRDMA
ncbi:MAG: hypothetical protein ACRDZW_07135 [Acidimicrobiales bacterium]